MTLKKSKTEKGQAIFEYFILTTVVVAVVLIFVTTKPFQDIRSSCEVGFTNAVAKIVK